MSSRLTPRTTADDHAIPPSPSAPPAPPALLWPSVGDDGRRSVDATHFPDRWKIHQRRKLCMDPSGTTAMTLQIFTHAVVNAHSRLLIMDRHFDETGVRSLQRAFEKSRASDVRLLTGSVDDLETKRIDLEGRINLYRSDQQVNVRWHTTLGRDAYPFLHDRFAVVDDALWHFGATVGGGHPSLNAASGPWPAEETRSVDFFEECWKESGALQWRRTS